MDALIAGAARQREEHAITCGICSTGRLCRREGYRLSPTLAFIGHGFIMVFLASVLALALVFVVGAGFAGVLSQSPASVWAKMFSVVAGALAGSYAVVIGFAGVCSTLPCLIVGLLLTLKRQVLQCDKCGATVSAS